MGSHPSSVRDLLWDDRVDLSHPGIGAEPAPVVVGEAGTLAEVLIYRRASCGAIVFASPDAGPRPGVRSAGVGPDAGWRGCGV